MGALQFPPIIFDCNIRRIVPGNAPKYRYGARPHCRTLASLVLKQPAFDGACS